MTDTTTTDRETMIDRLRACRESEEETREHADRLVAEAMRITDEAMEDARQHPDITTRDIASAVGLAEVSVYKRLSAHRKGTS